MRTLPAGFLALLARIWFAAGAREVVVPMAGAPGRCADGDIGPLRDARVRPRDLTLMAFHPLGTARARRGPARVRASTGDLQVHGLQDLYVADGSARSRPSLGVNPQLTIIALATRRPMAAPSVTPSSGSRRCSTRRPPSRP